MVNLKKLKCQYNFFNSISLEVKKKLIELYIFGLHNSIDFKICEKIENLNIQFFSYYGTIDNIDDKFTFPKKLKILTIQELDSMNICKKIEELKELEKLEILNCYQNIYNHIWNFTNTKLKIENIFFSEAIWLPKIKIISKKRIHLLYETKNNIIPYGNSFNKNIIKVCIRCKKECNKYILINIRKDKNFLYYTCC